MPAVLVCLIASLTLALAACGSGDDDDVPAPVLGSGEDQEQRGRATRPTSASPAFATKNTTRIGAPDSVVLAAATAQAVFPSRPPTSARRGRAVPRRRLARGGLGGAADGAADPGARCSTRASPDCRAPSQDALRRLAPARGRRGPRRPDRPDRRRRAPGRAAVGRRGRRAAREQVAQRIDELVAAAKGGPSPTVLVAALDAPAYAMPAAAWAAKSGDPVLWVERGAIPAATKAALRAHGKPRIYVLGPPSVVADDTVEALRAFGTVRRMGAEGPVRELGRVRAVPRRALRLGRGRSLGTGSCSPRPRGRPTPARSPRCRPPGPTAPSWCSSSLGCCPR